MMLGFFLAQCSKNKTSETTPAPPTIDPQKALSLQTQKNETKILEKKSLSTYTYHKEGLRDPFLSYFQASSKDQTTDVLSDKDTSADRYDLSQYRLIGVVLNGKNPQAMVEDPDGIGHILRIGSNLGKNNGIVRKITETEVLIVEDFRDPTGKQVEVSIPLVFPEGNEHDGNQKR